MDSNKLIEFHTLELSKINAELGELDRDPGKFIKKKLERLDADIARMPISKAKHKGNITMREHLMNLRADIERNTAKYLSEYRKNLLERKQFSETEVNILGGGNLQRI